MRQLMAEEPAETTTANMSLAESRKQPSIIALLFCDYAKTSPEGKLNISGIFDRIFVDPDIKKTPTFYVFLKLQEVFGSAEFHILNPAGKIIGAALYEVKQDAAKSDELNFTQASIRFMELETEEEGLYWFEIVYKGHSLGGTGLKVEFKKREN